MRVRLSFLCLTFGVIQVIPAQAIPNQLNQVMVVEEAKWQTTSGNTFVTVGNDNNCNFRSGNTRLQDAIDFTKSFGTDEIRVAADTYLENIQINDQDIVIRGGYANCADAISDNQTLGNTNTLLQASQTAPVVILIGTANPRSVTIERMRITGGVGNSIIPGGGISALANDLQLRLQDLTIDNNIGTIGGGVAIIGSTTLVGYNLLIEQNSANDGGGLYCANSNALINLFGDVQAATGIVSNEAVNGGGIYIDNGCQLITFVGGSADTLNPQKGIYGNFATNDGGGIYATGGSTVSLYGGQFPNQPGSNRSLPVNITINLADSDFDGVGQGGGVFAEGANTEVIMNNTLISDNRADDGAGIALANSASLISNLQATTAAPCWQPGACNQFIGNTTNGGNGGAIRLESNASAEVYRTQFERNRASIGTVIYALGTGTQFTGEGLLITGNGGFGTDLDDNNVIRLLGGAVVNLAWSTLADNNIPDTNEIIENSNSTISLTSSIIHENNPVPVYRAVSPVSETMDCLVVHEDNSINSSGSNSTNITVDDPEFIDRNNNDYHISILYSPAIDACNANNPPQFGDSDLNTRGFDLPNVPNIIGPYDIGYDEQGDLIYTNGFD